MNIEHLLLCIFPLVLFGIMAVKVKFAGKGHFHEDFLSLEQSKILQGITAVSIIFHHLSQYITNYGNEWKGPITIYSSIGILFTTFFFFCSGYGLVTSFNNKPDYLKTFFKKRIPSILIPFMLSNIIYLIFMGLYFGRVGSMLEGIANFFGIILINTNTWFLVEIMILYLAFYLIFRFIKKTNRAMATMGIFVVILITISFLLGHDNSENGGHWFMGEWWYNTTIFFWVGMLIAQYQKKIVAFFKKRYKWLVLISVVMFLATFVLEELIIRNFGYYQEWEGHPGYGAKAITLLSQIIVCFVWLIMVLLILLKVKFKNTILILLSKISLELYIMHDIFKVHFTTSRYRREDWAVFLWVMILSIGGAVALYFVNRFLINLVVEYKKTDENENLTLEQKIKKNQQKKLKTHIIISSTIVITIVSVIAAKELYQIFILPEKYYEEELIMLAEAEVGDEIVFGMFDLENNSFNQNRIEWIVIDKKDDKVLLISKDIVCKSFHNVYEDVTWEDCNLRYLLNDYYYVEAFTEKERALIVETVVDVSVNSEFGTDGGKGTTDKIFILSAEEADFYIYNDGVINIKEGNKWLWLRTMGESQKQAAVIDYDGEIDLKGRYITTGAGGVRPVMWVKCEP